MPPTQRYSAFNLESLAFVAVVASVPILWLMTRFVWTAESSASDHRPGSRGGFVVQLGREEFQVEAVIDAGTLSLFILDDTGTRTVDVEIQSLTAFCRSPQQVESVSVPLHPHPQPGDRRGRTSRFIGELPSDLDSFSTTVPNLRIGEQRYHFAFSTSDHSSTGGMPTKVLDDAERELYLTPRGAYTTADILANGSKTASEAFRGFVAEHDPSPLPGDRICPITRTKANPECRWIIDGEGYEFCCPPCIDEFVRRAKTSPETIEPPQAYVRR